MKKEIQFLGFVIALVVIIVMLFIGSVTAIDTIEINHKIYVAKITLNIAKEELKYINPELFNRYIQHPYSIDGHLAEMELREKYPIEYARYIQARIALDDLQYEKFLMFANAEHDKEV